MSSNGGMIKTHSEGDLITNGSPGKEYILNSAQHGEFIVNRESTSQHLGLLRAINADKNGNLKIKQNADGGLLSMSSLGLMTDMTAFMSSPLTQMIMKPEEFIKRINPYNSKIINLLEDISFNENRKKYGVGDPEEIEEAINKANEAIEVLTEKSEGFSKSASKIVPKLSKVGKGLGVMGVAAGAFSAAQAKYVEDGTNILDKGKANGGKIGAAAGAAITTGLLTAIPLVGPAIGPVLGPVVDKAIGQTIGEEIGSGSESRRNRKYGQFYSEFNNSVGQSKFGKLTGNYSTNELRQISKALNDGDLNEDELSTDLISKMKALNDGSIITAKHQRGGLLKGRSHANGGIIINEAEGGEYIINRSSAEKSMGLLNKINSGVINDNNIKAIEPMGRQMRVKETPSSAYQQTTTMKMEPLNVTVSGTIKLDTGNQTFDLGNEIFNNPLFINKLTEMIAKQMNIDDNGGFNRKDFYRRFTSI